MARGQYQTKVQRPTQAEPAPPDANDLACRTCPFWTRQDVRQGVCRGSAGPLTIHQGRGMFGVTLETDWCRLHPDAPKT